MIEPAVSHSAAADLPPRVRAVLVAALAGITAIAWLYLYLLTLRMPAMDGMAMAMSAAPAPWSAAEAGLMFVMWWVMMAGMMLPGVAPMVLTFATINRRKRARGQPYVPTAVFAAGYLLALGGFSLLATIAQWWLEQAALLSPMMRTGTPLLGGLLFVAAGVYQFTPLKRACLRHCRSPFAFIVNHWRDGTRGALVMGLGHGLYCLGCCWVVMALLFVGGVMNLLWVAALTAFVLLEKLLPGGERVARAGGALMLAFGGFLLLRGGA